MFLSVRSNTVPWSGEKSSIRKTTRSLLDFTSTALYRGSDSSKLKWSSDTALFAECWPINATVTQSVKDVLLANTIYSGLITLFYTHLYNTQIQPNIRTFLGIWLLCKKEWLTMPLKGCTPDPLNGRKQITQAKNNCIIKMLPSHCIYLL